MNNCEEIDKGNFDFLCNPIDSIICMQNVMRSEISISEKVASIYEGIKRDLLKTLMESYTRCMEKISYITDQSKNAFSIVQKLAGMSWRGWNIQAESYYQTIITQLRDMNQLGMVRLGESYTLDRQV